MAAATAVATLLAGLGAPAIAATSWPAGGRMDTNSANNARLISGLKLTTDLTKGPAEVDRRKPDLEVFRGGGSDQCRRMRGSSSAESMSATRLPRTTRMAANVTRPITEV